MSRIEIVCPKCGATRFDDYPENDEPDTCEKHFCNTCIEKITDEYPCIGYGEPGTLAEVLHEGFRIFASSLAVSADPDIREVLPNFKTTSLSSHDRMVRETFRLGAILRRVGRPVAIRLEEEFSNEQFVIFEANEAGEACGGVCGPHALIDQAPVNAMNYGPDGESLFQE